MSSTSDYIAILNNAVDSGGGVPAHLAAASGVTTVIPGFCGAWPLVKPILQVVAGATVWIPQYGALAGSVITGLIAVGDDIYNTECAVPAPAPTP